MPWYMPRAWRIHNIKKAFITRFVILHIESVGNYQLTWSQRHSNG